jgi:hypothetical protein
MKQRPSLYTKKFDRNIIKQFFDFGEKIYNDLFPLHRSGDFYFQNHPAATVFFFLNSSIIGFFIGTVTFYDIRFHILNIGHCS